MKEFKPPTDPALYALWIIRNWSRPTERGMSSMQSCEDKVRIIHNLSSEVLGQLAKEKQNENP